MTGRREFLKVAAGASLGTIMPAQAQSPSLPASPLVRPADLVLTNGKIITVDRGFTIAQAIAIAGDRIVAVGPDAAMAAHTAPGTRVVDLKGKAVMPGLVDGHAHMDREGLKTVYPAARTRALDPRHPGSHCRARAQQAARRMDRDHADRRSAVLFGRAGHPRRKALADPAGARCRGAEQSGVHPLDLGLLAPHAAARLLRQHRGLAARRHHPRHRLAGRHRSRSRRTRTATRPACSSSRTCSRSPS